jgi:hypothetical protein
MHKIYIKSFFFSTAGLQEETKIIFSTKVLKVKHFTPEPADKVWQRSR